MLEPETRTRVHAKCQFTAGGNFSHCDVEIRVIWVGPHKIAIDDDTAAVSFLELDEISDKIARKIYSKGNILRTPIAVFIPKSSSAVISFVGVFKSGNFYVPLDTKSPMDRISKILDTLNTACIITDAEHNNRLIQLKRNVAGLNGAKEKVDGFKYKSGRNGVFNDDPIMMSYGGGPGSELGIGQTNIYFASSGRFKTLSVCAKDTSASNLRLDPFSDPFGGIINKIYDRKEDSKMFLQS